MNTKNVATPQDLQWQDSALSALADGEVSADELDALLSAHADRSDLSLQWQSYQIIGEALRGRPAVGGACATVELLAGIHAGLGADTVSNRPVRLVEPAPVALAGRPVPAANDAVFRWQLVAGVASLAAVMAVSWSVLGSGAPGTTVPSQGAQLALVSPPATVSPAPATVVVQTGQGAVIRDPRLQELLAEHRQYGGMSALQMPAGFVRNATYDAAPQR